MAGLFKKNGRARRIPEKLAQYDDEYLLYCVEKDRVETVLESTLHETDDPKEIIDVTLKTVCEFYILPMRRKAFWSCGIWNGKSILVSQ